MRPALRQLVDYVKSTKVFRRNKKDIELKILAGLIAIDETKINLEKKSLLSSLVEVYYDIFCQIIIAKEVRGAKYSCKF